MTLSGYLLIGAGVVCAAVIAVSAVKVANAQRDASSARAEAATLRAEVAKQREDFERAARATETRHRAAVDAIDDKYTKERADREKKHTADVARVHAGYRLRDPGARPSCPGNATGAAAATGSDGAKAGELSEQATTFLLGLADEADAVVEQLGACQQYAASVQQPQEQP